MSDWLSDAACLDDDPEDYFPAQYGRHLGALRGPQETCRTCPVQERCLDLVMALPPYLDIVGIFGGLTPSDRRDLRAEPMTDPTHEVYGWLRGGPPNGTRPAAVQRSA